jgi:hypothetical protein
MERLITHLAANAATISNLFENVSDEQARWKPAPKDWSMLEVINHLYDEEREDFRQRLDYILHKPGEPWPPTDPQGWVTARNYQSRDLQESLANFLDERAQSLAWLGTLEKPNWEQGETHPAGFVLTAGDMLASWVAHDFLHMRQLVELHYLHHAQAVQPYSVEYAGEWD